MRLAEAVGPAYAPMVYLGAVLGLRWGECAGLRVGRIDFLRRRLTVAVQRTHTTDGHMVEGPPKSREGRRDLSVPDWLLDSPRRPPQGQRSDRRRDFGLRVRQPAGRAARVRPLAPAGVVPATEAAGLPGLHFHDLRRANATMLVAEGVDPKTAQRRLGHADIRMTLDVYAQALDSAEREAGERLGARFKPRGMNAGWNRNAARRRANSAQALSRAKAGRVGEI